MVLGQTRALRFAIHICSLVGYESLWAIFTEIALPSTGGRGIQKDKETVWEEGGRNKGRKWIKENKYRAG
jgi:hypothetical protein